VRFRVSVAGAVRASSLAGRALRRLATRFFAIRLAMSEQSSDPFSERLATASRLTSAPS
jgi:hypothetical protein